MADGGTSHLPAIASWQTGMASHDLKDLLTAFRFGMHCKAKLKRFQT
ncbi:unnamed protein product [Victoria cruziana]